MHGLAPPEQCHRHDAAWFHMTRSLRPDRQCAKGSRPQSPRDAAVPRCHRARARPRASSVCTRLRLDRADDNAAGEGFFGRLKTEMFFARTGSRRPSKTSSQRWTRISAGTKKCTSRARRASEVPPSTAKAWAWLHNQSKFLPHPHRVLRLREEQAGVVQATALQLGGGLGAVQGHLGRADSVLTSAQLGPPSPDRRGKTRPTFRSCRSRR